MQPIRAKFAGTCARTGQPYQAGALIVKLADGNWALAQTRSGAVKVAPDYRLCRLPDGTEKSLPVNLPAYCRDCIHVDGLTSEIFAKIPAHDQAAYAMTREGDHIVCPRCERTIEIISDTEIARREVEREAQRQVERMQSLHLYERDCSCGTPGLELSHKIGPDLWKRVSQYFTYWTRDELDEMDYFGAAEMGGGWFCSPANAPAIEAALGIREENTFAVRQARLQQERETERQAAAERRERESQFRVRFREGGEYLWGKDHTSLVLEGERIDIGEGQNLYGGGEWFVLDSDGQHVWHIRNNGMDGDDWSRNNIRTGGAGAIGLRYLLTPERAECVQWAREGKIG